MDALAHSGVLFTAGYVTASVCNPSRAAIMTGRYQTRFGHELLPIGQQNLDPLAGMSLSERTLADELKAAGYRTGMVGKWHLGAAPVVKSFWTRTVRNNLDVICGSGRGETEGEEVGRLQEGLALESQRRAAYGDPRNADGGENNYGNFQGDGVKQAHDPQGS
jgi:arylsulfatase A-like enzyme